MTIPVIDFPPETLVYVRTADGSVHEAIVAEASSDPENFVHVQLVSDLDEFHAAEDAAAATGEGTSAAAVTIHAIEIGQCARSIEALLEAEAPPTGAELQALVDDATNAVASTCSNVIQQFHQYAATRWGEGSQRYIVARAAASGAMIGSGQAQMVGANEASLGVADATARLVAIHYAKLLGRDVSELERVQSQREIEAAVAESGLVGPDGRTVN